MTDRGSPAVIAKALSKVPGLLFEEVTTRIEDYLRDFSGTMQRQAGSRLKVRTGSLAGSFHPYAQGDSPETWRAGVFTDSPSAPRQEFGGTTRARTKKYLAIPLDAALTPAGVTKADPLLWANTFVAESKSGKVFIFRRTGRKRPKGWKKGQDDPTIEPLFLLKQSAGPIPARLGFFSSWDEESGIRAKILGDAALAALKRA